MNTFAERFTTTGPSAELRNLQKLSDEEDESNAMWGSQAGFGSLSKGVPAFSIPAVAEVRFRARIVAHPSISDVFLLIACCFLETPHR